MKEENKNQQQGANQSNETGVTADKEKLERDQELTDKYTKDDQGIADHVRTNNPNRNVDKEDATNAGGYRN